MAKSILLATQAAIKAALGTAVTLNSTPLPVYDTPPNTAVLPYLVVSDLNEMPNDTHDATSRILTATIHAWVEDSETAGSTNCKSVIAQVAALLIDASLTITSGTHRHTLLEMHEHFRDPDGQTWHGVMRYRMWVDSI